MVVELPPLLNFLNDLANLSLLGPPRPLAGGLILALNQSFDLVVLGPGPHLKHEAELLGVTLTLENQILQVYHPVLPPSIDATGDLIRVESLLVLRQPGLILWGASQVNECLVSVVEVRDYLAFHL